MSEIFPEQPITSLPDAVAFLGALPMPVGPVPPASERDRLRAAFIKALDTAARTHPCPALGDQTWSGCVHYDDAGRITGVGSCHSERRADAVLAVRDAEVEFLIGEADRLSVRVAELEAERRTTNEALSEAAEALRAGRGDGCSCPPADRPHQVGCPLDGVPRPADGPGPSVEESADKLSRFFSPVAALREVPSGETDPARRAAWRMLSREEPHDSPLHQNHLVPHDLPVAADLPVPDGCQLTAEQLDEVSRDAWFGGAS